MNELKLAKRANGLFFMVVLLSLLANVFVSVLSLSSISLPIVPNLLISQMIILVPGLIYYLLITRKVPDFKMYRKIKPVTVVLLFVFTWLIMPLVTAVNAFSQIFTRNEVMTISGDVLELPMIPMILIMGILGPFCEEFVFRGLINNSILYQSGRYIASGVLSGAFFGLMHMNFNQFCYAFVLGVIFALINDALESTWPSFICHAIINTQNVLMLFLMDKLLKSTMQGGIADIYNEQAASGETKIYTIIMFVVLLFISVITCTLAGLLFYGICSIEGRTDRFKTVFLKKGTGGDRKIIYPTGIAAISVCIFVIFLLEPIINLLK